MNEILQTTYLSDILHSIAQSLLGPTMIVIILLVAMTLFFIGQLIVEAVTERRSFKQNMPAIINEINDAGYDEVTGIIERGELLRYQKAALLTVSKNMGLPEEPLFALAQVEVARVSKHYKNRLGWTETMSKVGPMLGLMGTLIPLGPGIVALGQGNTEKLSQSLLVAFDATVCGLVCAIITLVISKIRSGWYEEYLSSLEAIMTCIIDKADTARKAGVVLPANYKGDPIEEYREFKKSGGKLAVEGAQS